MPTRPRCHVPLTGAACCPHHSPANSGQASWAGVEETEAFGKGGGSCRPHSRETAEPGPRPRLRDSGDTEPGRKGLGGCQVPGAGSSWFSAGAAGPAGRSEEESSLVRAEAGCAGAPMAPGSRLPCCGPLCDWNSLCLGYCFAHL